MLFPLIFGVIIQFYFAYYFPYYLLLSLTFVLLLTALPVFSKNRFTSKFFVPLAVFAFFGLGGYLGAINDSRTSPNYFWAETSYEASNFACKILEPPQEKERSVKCVVQVFQKEDQRVQGKTLIYLEKDSASLHLSYGDILYLKGRFNAISQNKNPKEFNYKRYLRIHDIHQQAYLKSGEWQLQRNEGSPALKSIYDLRKHLSGVLQNSGMSDKNVMVANALLLGQKELLDKEVLRSYSSAGAMHVLAVSGLHVGIVMLILNFAFSPIKKRKFGKSLFLILVLGGVWFYAIITGLSPSVLRAAVMFTFIVLGKELQRDTSIYQSLMFSAFLLIIYEPYIIFQVGFQLSYLAVLGIVYLQPKIVNWFYFSNFILDKAWQITAVSLAAQLATFPLGLYYFHQFPNFFMLSNLIVIPLAFVLLIVGIVYLLFYFVPIVSHLLLLLFDQLLSLLNYGVEWVEKLPYSILWGISIEWFEVLLIYIALILGVAGLTKKKWRLISASASIAVILLVFNIIEKVQLSNENRVFIYNIKDELAVDVFYGTENRFYASERLMNDESKLLFHVKHNWFYRSGQEKPTEYFNNDGFDFLKCKDLNIVFLDSVVQNELSFLNAGVDYYVLHNINFISAKNIDQLKDLNGQLILMPSVSYKAANYIKSAIDKNRIFDITEEGCFELVF